MRSYEVKNRTKFWIKLLALVLIGISVFAFLRSRKDALIRECVHLLERTLSQSTQMDVKIGKVSGNLLGLINFQDIQVVDPDGDPQEPPVLKIKELQFQYRFLDLLSKKFNSKIVLIIKSPEIHWSPYIGLRHSRFPFFGWMHEWMLSQKNNFMLKAEDASLFLKGYKPLAFRGINAQVEGESFHFEVPISHVAIGRSDVTSVMVIDGKFDLGPESEEDLLSGQIHTEGTVIDWKPISQEASFNFIFSQKAFQLNSTSFVGGIQIDGVVDFANDYNLALTIRAKDVPMSELGFFVNLNESIASANRFDLEADFDGNLLAPHLNARARIYNGFIGQRAFKAMDINVEGVYPTVTLNNSRILLEDGSTMFFADKSLEIGDLGRGSTFEMLVNESEQDTVVWGNWEFSRPRDSEDRPEFFMQRLLGQHARVHFRKMNEDEDREMFQERESRDMEVGFEYKLQSKDSFKVEYRDDQEVVGVLERKLTF